LTITGRHPQALDEAGLVRIPRGSRKRHEAPTGSVLISSNCSPPTASAAQLSVANRQPAHRFLRRQPRQPHALTTRGGGCDPRCLAAPKATRHAHHRLRWVDGGITTDEAGIFASELRAVVFDYVCVSGGISPHARPAVAPSYQVPLAAAVKKASGIAVQAVGRSSARTKRK
jgi:hypothetical protein